MRSWPLFSPTFFSPGGLRAPCVLACPMRSLAIVITIVQSSLGPGGFMCATRGGVAMRSRPLLLPSFSLSFSFFLRLLLLTHFGESPVRKQIFFFCIYLLVMPKYWVKNYFAHGRFPEVGQKQKTEKKKKKERKTERW